MKECPKCRTVFPDDLFFCLDDGTPLIEHQVEHVDPDALTEPAFKLGYAAPTEVIPRGGVALPTEILSAPGRTTPTREPDSPRPQRTSPKLAYVAIAVLALVCVSLATALAVLNRNRIFSTKNANSNIANDTKSTPVPTPEAADIVTAATPAKTSAPEKVIASQSVTVDGKWKGQWSTTSGTVANIELTIKETETSIIDGQIRWVLQKSARPDKTDKIGLSATEFVRGTFAESTGSLTMSGYRKDDPDGVLVMLDDYKLTLSKDGRSLNGVARNGGKWDGHIKLAKP